MQRVLSAAEYEFTTFGLAVLIPGAFATPFAAVGQQTTGLFPMNEHNCGNF